MAQQSLAVRLVSEELPPFQYFQGKKVVGSNIDLLRTVFEQAQLSFPQVELYPWARAYQLAITEANTLIFPIVRTKQREDELLWIAPIASATYYLFAHKDRVDIHLSRLEQVKRHKMATMKGDISHSYMLSKGFEQGKHFVLASSWTNIEKLFFNGKLDLLISTQNFFELQAQRNGANPSDYQAKLALKDLKLEFYLAANKMSEPELVSRLRKHMPSRVKEY